MTDNTASTDNKKDSVVSERLTITDVAKKVGVTPKTIVRWEKAGRIRKPKRDWKGWRFYSDEDVEGIKRIVNTVYDESELISNRRYVSGTVKAEG